MHTLNECRIEMIVLVCVGQIVWKYSESKFYVFKTKIVRFRFQRLMSPSSFRQSLFYYRFRLYSNIILRFVVSIRSYVPEVMHTMQLATSGGRTNCRQQLATSTRYDPSFSRMSKATKILRLIPLAHILPKSEQYFRNLYRLVLFYLIFPFFFNF